MPKNAPLTKIQNTKKYGAKVILYDTTNQKREKIAQEIAFNEDKTIIKPYDDLDIIPFPSKLDDLNSDSWKHDFIFVRDLFVSNQNGDVVVARFREKERQAEEEIIEEWLMQQDVKVHKLPFDKNYFVEGGEFYFCPQENILFAGTGRNNTIGNTKTAELLNVDELVELSTEAFHLDTVFTPVLNKQNELCLVIVCTQLLEYESLQRLQTFTKTKGIQLLDIPLEETIGLGTQLGSFAANCLPLPGILLGSSAFVSESVNLALAEHNITHSIVPLTQFRLSGGSVHCLTNEL